MTQSTPGPIPPLTDPEDALRRAGNRPEVATELFELLQSSLGSVATNLADAGRNHDRERLRETAHRLHGATLYCGVPRLRVAVAEVERLCNGADARTLDRALAWLLEVAEATRRADDPVRGRVDD